MRRGSTTAGEAGGRRPAAVKVASETLLQVLRAIGEPTRLRLVALLADGELNVSDLTRVLAQSQPRISRHLKVLLEAGVVERFQEGAWVFFRLAETGEAAGLARGLVHSLDPADPQLVRDRRHSAEVKAERAAAAQAYFRAHAAEWDSIRRLHVAEAQVEAAILEALGPERVELLVDLGTGTGRILELTAPLYERSLGIDASQAMLKLARANLEKAGLVRAQVRQADLLALPLAEATADRVVLHQVLHFLEQPARALAEAARILKPGGLLLVADFAPHELEFLRERHAHRRLGFSTQQMAGWIADAGLALASVRQLHPEAGAGGLTVSLWVGRKA